ncbi:MAG: Holliday junction branch migration protein RuvA [Candidatus Doudnabacteria bacterium CG10_big_fil_rev_8_21_14_0_10_42_18]|uniref:Holliday junction branch migration complex subunit RuvA n=1 Tax=Candidatus Doudnabacteria bacterium CG10_big_fil_rev_8_21_14_0_10_42_18 TaxID=1974552 RepID=A0A2H0VBF6_9BACT|nr:MAG: Holliday junction branch migration protein RuvA [Candidatus Doudnabacteria bacterium CG10_big_fil_rev_8_21_14_0_10_42_18]
MIAYLKGIILEKGLTYIIVVNQGIGYKVFVTPEMLSKQAGDEAALFIYHKSTDDGQSLFGLPDFEALKFFEMLITVSGVGPKVALAILSTAKAEAVKDAIARQDAGIFTRIAGVGTKTAEKIIVELKNKVGTVGGSGGSSSEVFDALLSLGYNQREVRDAVQKVDSSKPREEQLKEALKFLGKNN